MFRFDDALLCCVCLYKSRERVCDIIESRYTVTTAFAVREPLNTSPIDRRR
jgi:hypothetical protein